MGNFLGHMDNKWAQPVNPAYQAIRPTLENIDTLEPLLRAVMRDVYIPLQREYASTSFLTFLERQIKDDEHGQEKSQKIEQAAKAKVANYWQSVASGLATLDLAQSDTITQAAGTPAQSTVSVRAVMLAFIPASLDDVTMRQRLVNLAKEYVRKEVANEPTDEIITEIQNITWESIQKAPLPLVLEAGVGAEITSETAALSKGAARSGACDAVCNEMFKQFVSQGEMRRIYYATQAMSIVLPVLTAVDQCLSSDDIDRLEGLAPAALAQVESCVNGMGYDTLGLTQLVQRLISVELQEVVVAISQRKKSLANANLRVEIINLIGQSFVEVVSNANLSQMMQQRRLVLDVTEDCNNADLSIQQIVDRTKGRIATGADVVTKKLNEIAGKALGKLSYGAALAFSSLDLNASTGIPNKQGQPIQVSAALLAMDMVVMGIPEDVKKYYDHFKRLDGPLTSAMRILLIQLAKKVTSLESELAAVAGNNWQRVSSMSIAMLIESGLGFKMPKPDAVAAAVWEKISNHPLLKDDPLIINIQCCRIILQAAMTTEGKAAKLLSSLSAEKHLGSESAAFTIAKDYKDIVIQYEQNLDRANQTLARNDAAWKIITPELSVMVEVPADKNEYTPKTELDRRMHAIALKYAGKKLSLDKTNVMKLMVELHAFAVSVASATNDLGQFTLDMLSRCDAFLEIPDEKHDQAILNDYIAGLTEEITNKAEAVVPSVAQKHSALDSFKSSLLRFSAASSSFSGPRVDPVAQQAKDKLLKTIEALKANTSQGMKRK